MARKAHNIHYIYKTTCNVTGKYYVGMHSTSDENDGYMGSGLQLRRSIRKHGVDNHTKEILSYHDTRELLIEAEKIVITDDMILDKNCMNLKLGGTGGFSSEEHMMTCSKAGNVSYKNRLDIDESFREKTLELLLSNVKKAHKNGNHKYNKFQGKKHSEESKKLISKTKQGQGSGEANSQFGTCWINNGVEDKKIKKDDLAEYLDNHWVKGRYKRV